MDEIILVVNERNEVVGTAPRKEATLQKLWHRASYVFVYNRELKTFAVQLRSKLKRYCPGYFDLANGGVMSADDGTDLVNAQREVAEELGISLEALQEENTKYPLWKIKTLKFEVPDDNFFCNVYLLVYDGEFKI